MEDIQIKPTSGIGSPERLLGYKENEYIYSRRINIKHRLVYEIIDSSIIKLLSAYGIMMINKFTLHMINFFICLIIAETYSYRGDCGDSPTSYGSQS